MDKERIEDIRYHLEIIQDSIRDLALDGGRDPTEIKLIAVSKNFPLEDLAVALEAGQTVFGENRVQELTAKAREAREAGLAPDWHM
ncbi:MAG TPA: YggS family pyridoxal phosphate-dependent enzyme, partial [Clostridia bacterium]|nr:YggS family pyridoxal phosphate-dependent enzyme [Clostridia bacterium]